MNKFSKRLREVRESLGMNKTQFAKYLGTSLSNITRYENGDMGVSLEAVRAIGEKLKVNPGWLLGWTSEKYIEDTHINYKKIPILGVIAAGEPIFAQENIEGYEYVPESLSVDFCLRVKGDSMINARILDGDIVYIRMQPSVDNGEIAAVIIDSDEATLKRVYKANKTVILHAENPKYEDKIFIKKEIQRLKIIGKAVMFKSIVR